MTTLDLNNLLMADAEASKIADFYVKWKASRATFETRSLETRNYVYATDTRTTTNSKLPWKNKTTRPKLCQIADNLEANYMAALFPTDRWMRWQADNEDDATRDKAKAIEAYMYHKFRESRFKETVQRAVRDYILCGNAVGDVKFVNETQTNEVGGKSTVYIGPKLVRVSPFDIVFDITAPSFIESPKITRSLISMGQIEKLRRTDPDWAAVAQATLDKIKENRKLLLSVPKTLERADVQKIQGLIADGFSTLLEYYSSGMVEFLEFEGDLYVPTTGELLENYVITIVDRLYVVRKQPINNWFNRSYKQHVGWRLRPDNLIAMGPLDNLVGLQYRLDHLENLKADAFDLIAFPPLKIKGYVEDFEWGPNERAYMEQDADVEPMAPDTTVLSADLEIQRLEQTMEEMAGAPKQAMGIRTPGEKTAFEVQELMNAASRIFQHKTAYFEENFLEPLMNGMLETARRNMQLEEIVNVINDETGVAEFLTITPADLEAHGKLVPMGARHFAAQAQLIQNLANLSSTQLYQDPFVATHLSGKKIAQLLEENLGLERFKIYQPNIRVTEQLETQSLAVQAEEELTVDAMTPTQTPDEAAALEAQDEVDPNV